MIRMKHSTFVVLLFSVIYAVSCKRSCKDGKPLEPYPSTIKDTTILLEKLRKLMNDSGIDGYLIPSSDDHQTEYVAPWFKRRAFITGFTGSAGTAVVTKTKAALWVDGRYHDQSDTEVDCNWIIQKQGLPGVPAINDWIGNELERKITGFDPRVVSYKYKSWLEKLGSQYTFKNVDDNLIDKIWDDRPKITNHSIFIQPDKFAGQNFTSKLANLRKTMFTNKAEAIIIESLDEVAWLLNLRGNDIPYNPFFYAYVLVTDKDVKLFIDKTKLTREVDDHLCAVSTGPLYCVDTQPYSSIQQVIKDVSKKLNRRFWMTLSASVYISDSIKDDHKYVMQSPIQLPKAMKNPVEIAGMKIANIRDGVAIMEYFVWLKEQISAGNRVTEMTGAEQLKKFKSKQKDFRGLSFSTISGFGPNGAIIHYKANNHTDAAITDKSMYLLDSGAHFPELIVVDSLNLNANALKHHGSYILKNEGSTDITRTIHLGTPTDYEKEMFTKVMKGAIGLARIKFPSGTFGRNIDILARQYLWKDGLDYRHGTGHGIGSYLSIHEGPGRINTGRGTTSASALYEGMVFSDEPGYYESGKFGIRLETAITIRPAKTKYKMAGRKFYEFEVITWVPFERKLINIDMLDDTQIEWLNNYNKDIRNVMGSELKKQGKAKVYEYMLAQTEKFARTVPSSASINTISSILFTLVIFWSIIC